MPEPIDIPPKDLMTVQEILKRHVSEYEVRAFGSRVTWMAKEYSDLDLAIMTDTPLTTSRMADLRETFTESNLSIKVDLVDWAAISEGFKKIVQKKYVTVQEKKSGNRSAESEKSKVATMKIKDISHFNTDTYSPKDNWEYFNYLDTGGITEGDVTEVQFITDIKLLPSRARRKIQPGDIVYSTVRPNQKHYGIIEKPLKNMLVSTGFSVICGKEDLCDTQFLYYFLTQNHVVDYLQTIAEHNTSTYPSIRPSDIESMEIFLPSFSNQKIISRILGTLDEKIALNRKTNETLEAMARALFKSWFIDFDPVRAKVEGRDTGLPKDIADLFPSKFENSELGEFPKGWEVKNLGDLMELAYGKALKAENRIKGNVPVYGSNGQVGWHDKKLVSGPGIIVGRKGNPGIVTWAFTDFYAIDTAFYVAPKACCQSLHFLYYVLQTHELASLGADSAVPGLNRNLAYMDKQVLPSWQLLDEFDSRIKLITKLIYSHNQESNSLISQREILLPKLITGKLSVMTMENNI